MEQSHSRFGTSKVAFRSIMGRLDRHKTDGRIATIVSRCWSALSSVNLTVFISLALFLDLFYGYFRLKGSAPIFSPLRDISLQEWLQTYGWNNIDVTGWFILLLLLMIVLSINTFACTTTKVVGLVRDWPLLTLKDFLFRLAPHLMHYAFILLLVGYLVSFACSKVFPIVGLLQGRDVTLPGTDLQIRADSFDYEYYWGDRLGFMKNRVLEPTIHLTVRNSHESKSVTISVNKPVYFGRYQFFLKDFFPKSKDGMRSVYFASLHVRKDPGIELYLSAIGVFVLGLSIYLSRWINFKSSTFAYRGLKDHGD